MERVPQGPEPDRHAAARTDRRGGPGGLRPQQVGAAIHQALRYMVLREFTTGVRRTDCLESMGLARVAYDGLTPARQGAAGLGRR